jgi:uncharacterized protein YndB with AHSA1/START domain
MNSTRISYHVNAPRAKVYSALIDPNAIAKWKAPNGMTCQVHAFEAWEGGKFRISLAYDAPSGVRKTTAHTDTYTGRFVKLVPNEQVVEVDEFETADPRLRGEMTITITLKHANGGTDLVAVHDGLPDGRVSCGQRVGVANGTREARRAGGGSLDRNRTFVIAQESSAAIEPGSRAALPRGSEARARVTRGSAVKLRMATSTNWAPKLAAWCFSPLSSIAILPRANRIMASAAIPAGMFSASTARTRVEATTRRQDASCQPALRAAACSPRFAIADCRLRHLSLCGVPGFTSPHRLIETFWL